MENCDSFEEEEATIAAISQKYEILFLKVALQKVSEGTLSVYAASKKYDILERTISWGDS